MVVKSPFIPDRGDIIWISFDPTRGHEQKGHRPALVLSPKSYNQKSGLALMCPISSVSKGYAFEVPVLVQKTPSVILADQVRSFDYRLRKAQKIHKAPGIVTATVQEYIQKLVAE